MTKELVYDILPTAGSTNIKVKGTSTMDTLKLNVDVLWLMLAHTITDSPSLPVTSREIKDTVKARGKKILITNYTDEIVMLHGVYSSL